MKNTKPKFLNSFKNRFIDTIRKEGLEPIHFKTYELYESYTDYFVVELKNSPLQFRVINYKDSYDDYDYKYVQFSPSFVLTSQQYISCTADIIYEKFSEWINTHIIKYIDNSITPNYWERIETDGDILFANYDDDYEFKKFNKDEIKQIKMSINEFKVLIINEFHPDVKELNIIENRLEYLSESLNRLNKIDWKGLAISTVISISIALSLNTTSGHKLFELFKSVFHNVLYLLK